jgi:DNA polymerase III epsilon subunit family exonuclease
MSFQERRHRRGKQSGRKGKSPRDMILPPVDDQGRARLKRALKESEFIVFDIETTGGNPERNGITEIFAIRYRDGEILGTFYSLVNPGISIPPIVRKMTGITNQMVRSAPPISDVIPQFLEFIGQDVMVSHNTIGDMKFIRHFAKECVGVDMENFYLCTHLLVEKLVSDAPDKSLRGLAKFFNFQSGNLHRAEADAYVTLDLFKELKSRLGQVAVERIEDAIRLQADLESALRLGWGVQDEVVKALPHGPGVFYLHDHSGKVMLASSSFDVAHDVQKMQQALLLPKQLMRLALRTYHVTAAKSTSRFAAMLAECKALSEHKVQTQPSSWHRREVQAFCLKKDAGQLQIKVSSLEEGTNYAFGPLRDHRLAGIFLADLAKVFATTLQKGGVLLLPETTESMVLALFNGSLAEKITAVEGRLKSFSVWFKPSERRSLKEQLRLLRSLIDVRLPFKVEALHNVSGYIALPVAGGRLEVHTIIGLRPDQVDHVKGLDEQHNDVTRIIDVAREKALAYQTTDSPIPLSESAALEANAVLWWMLNVRGEGRFKAFR